MIRNSSTSDRGDYHSAQTTPFCSDKVQRSRRPAKTVLPVWEPLLRNLGDVRDLIFSSGSKSRGALPRFVRCDHEGPPTVGGKLASYR
jgi:hypothetical protein